MMNAYYITFRSVTPAQRGESLLRKSGYRCVLQRTPKWMQENGCGYGLRLTTNEISDGMRLLDRAGVPYRKVYLLHPEGNTEEIRV